MSKPDRAVPGKACHWLLCALGLFQSGLCASRVVLAQAVPASPQDAGATLVASASNNIAGALPVELDAAGKTSFYTHRILNPATFLGPATEAGFIMAAPPKAYPPEWRQGAAAYWRNYGSALGRQQTGEFSRFAAGVALREDPRYYPSTRIPVFARIVHALAFTFVDRSDDGDARLAFANLIGAVAGGLVGDAYLPTGYTDWRHSGVRTGVQMSAFGASNLVDEFRPELNRLKRFLSRPLHRD